MKSSVTNCSETVEDPHAALLGQFRIIIPLLGRVFQTLLKESQKSRREVERGRDGAEDHQDIADYHHGEAGRTVDHQGTAEDHGRSGGTVTKSTEKLGLAVSKQAESSVMASMAITGLDNQE